MYGDLFDFLHSEMRRLPEGADDDLWVDALLDERLTLFEELTSQKYHTSCTISYLQQQKVPFLPEHLNYTYICYSDKLLDG